MNTILSSDHHDDGMVIVTHLFYALLLNYELVFLCFDCLFFCFNYVMKMKIDDLFRTYFQISTPVQLYSPPGMDRVFCDKRATENYLKSVAERDK